MIYYVYDPTEYTFWEFNTKTELEAWLNRKELFEGHPENEVTVYKGVRLPIKGNPTRYFVEGQEDD